MLMFPSSTPGNLLNRFQPGQLGLARLSRDRSSQQYNQVASRKSIVPVWARKLAVHSMSGGNLS